MGNKSAKKDVLVNEEEPVAKKKISLSKSLSNSARNSTDKGKNNESRLSEADLKDLRKTLTMEYRSRAGTTNEFSNEVISGCSHYSSYCTT